MRIFSYIFTALVTIFVINVALSFSLPAYRGTLINMRSAVFPPSGDTDEREKAASRESESARLALSLDRIDKHIESLDEMRKANAVIMVMSGWIDSGSGQQDGSTLSRLPDIPISGLFLAKIMPEVAVKKVDNSWFFDIRIMGKLTYTTYLDEKKKIKIYAFADTYDTLLLNMKLTTNVFSINETDQFFWYTFFLNPTKKDPKDITVRFITSVEGRAVGIEVPKNYYSTFKKMLLKNK